MKRLLFAALLLTSTTALADIPPNGPVDPCTVENFKKEGEECMICVNGERPDTSCGQEAQKRGYEKRCTTQRAGISDIWCGIPAAPRDTTPPPTEPTKSGICSVDITNSSTQIAWPLGLFFGLALYLRRRSRNRTRD